MKKRSKKFGKIPGSKDWEGYEKDPACGGL
jgi:hypothetical protein